MIVDLAVPVPIPGTFHYRLSDELRAGLRQGSVVQVPFGKRRTHAFVLGFPTESSIDPGKLKDVESVLLADPLFDEGMLTFLRWVSDYYCYPIGEVLGACAPKNYWRVLTHKPKRKTKAVDTMGLETISPPAARPELNEEQRFALARILDPDEKRPVLLHGVTGSGKTEVYMSALEHYRAQGKGAIILVPEIALTPQLLGRFSARFPGEVAVLHSDLTAKERHHQFERVRQGRAPIVIGARSAVFAPVQRLGLIVVDEEHETSFKQEDSLRYHGRDVAIKRALLGGARVVLGSATPSLESYTNAHTGKYLYVTIKKRVQNRPLPRTVFVDLKDRSRWESPDTPWLSAFLFQRIERVLKEGQQSLLYLNRLGFAHFLFCEDCGHTWRCPNCDVALTYYRMPPSLKCHYCGLENTPPANCEQCEGIKLQTMGIGTEQVEKELQARLPTARIVRMDRSIVKNRTDLDDVLGRISRREADIVIGTQMIAKGHDFPGIALVGILMADAHLNLPDFRAHEKTFQVITQVSGRAGRAETPGEVVVQTLNPDHPILRAAAENRGYDFYQLEMQTRKQFGFPPFQRLAMVRFQHQNLKDVERFADETVRFLHYQVEKQKLQCTILGPSEAPLARLKNVHRWQCLLKAPSVKDLNGLLRVVLGYAAQRKNRVQLSVDVDPINPL